MLGLVSQVDGSSNLEAVFTASDKAQMRANIIAGILTMDQKTILTATCDAAVAICHADFPVRQTDRQTAGVHAIGSPIYYTPYTTLVFLQDKWPELLPALVGHLKSDNPLVMHNVRKPLCPHHLAHLAHLARLAHTPNCHENRCC